jgi:type IV fimbrial biogenesis protein FimT
MAMSELPSYIMIMKKHSGYTLIELMAILSVIAIVLATGLPLMSIFFQGNRMVSNTNEIVAGLHIARSEAIKQQMRVTMCQSTNRATCAGTGSWEDGFIVFQDPNGNATVDGGERILRINTGADGKQVTVRSDDGGSNQIKNAVTFTSRGLPKLLNGTSTSGTFRVCDSRGKRMNTDNETTVARGVVLSISGRVRTTKTAAKIASCP